MSSIVVQKFGGTSLATLDCRQSAVGRIADCIAQGLRPVVVVSAIGRQKDPYSTDALQSLATLPGASLARRDKDLISSCGEVISSVIIAQHLNARGISAIPLTGAQAGLCTNDDFGQSRVLEVDTENIEHCLNEGVVPVVAGYQGMTRHGEVTTLGRGGSDTTACILGVALKASLVEIFTDVDGVMTADPRIVHDARLLEKVHYDELSALAQKGAKIVEPNALRIASDGDIRLSIRSTGTKNAGTSVDFSKSNRPVTGIASLSNIDVFEVLDVSKSGMASELDVFRVIADHKISVHFIAIGPSPVSFVVSREAAADLADCLSSKSVRFRQNCDFAKVSVVGVGMTGQYGMMSTVVRALAENHIELHRASDSPTSISCLVSKSDERLAVKSLHRAFGLHG